MKKIFFVLGVLVAQLGAFDIGISLAPACDDKPVLDEVKKQVANFVLPNNNGIPLSQGEFETLRKSGIDVQLSGFKVVKKEDDVEQIYCTAEASIHLNESGLTLLMDGVTRSAGGGEDEGADYFYGLVADIERDEVKFLYKARYVRNELSVDVMSPDFIAPEAMIEMSD